MTKVSNHLGASTAYYIDTEGRKTKVTNPAGGDSVYYYDILDRTTKAADPAGGETAYGYSNIGLVTKVTAAASGESVYEYDGSGRQTRVIDADGVFATQYFDRTGRLTKAVDALSNATVYTRDIVGRVTEVTDPNSKVSRYYYSPMNHVTKVTDASGNDTVYTYYWPSYSDSGILTKVTTPDGRNTHFGHDQYGRLTLWRQYKRDPEDLQDLDFSIWDERQMFSYDALGRLTGRVDFYEEGTRVDGSGWEPGHVNTSRATTWSYDASGLLTMITYPDATTGSFSYDILGNKTLATATNVYEAYAYDDVPRLTRASYSYDGSAQTKHVSYAYDTQSRATKVTDGEGVGISYSYADGRLEAVAEADSPRGTYSYTPAGRRTTVTLGNGAYRNYAYDAAGRLTGVGNKKSDATLISGFAYSLDPAGMRTKMDIGGTAYTAASVAYGYDNTYQLTKETRTGGSAYTQEFSYDSAGHRTRGVLGSTTTDYLYDSTFGQLTKVGTNAVTWDYWGNMTGIGGVYNYSFDCANRLTRYSQTGMNTYDASYAYLPGSWKRYKKVLGGVAEYYLYSGDNVIDAYNVTPSLNARYIMAGLDEPVSETRSSNAYYYLTDGLGSVRNVINSSESTNNIYDSYAYGNNLGSPTQGITNPYRFTARDYEPGSGLYYLRNRYYLPDVGLFLSRDAMKYDSARGWGYVDNSPLNLTDPNGLGVLEWIKKVLLPTLGLIDPPVGLVVGAADKGVTATLCINNLNDMAALAAEAGAPTRQEVPSDMSTADQALAIARRNQACRDLVCPVFDSMDGDQLIGVTMSTGGARPSNNPGVDVGPLSGSYTPDLNIDPD